MSRRHVHGSEAKRFIYEADRKGGYGKPIKMSRLKMVREGLKEMKQEIILWTDEVKETFMADPFVVYRPGEVDVVWKFGTPEVHSKWVTTADSDHGEGLSECELSVSPSGGALFSGTLSTQVPRDGRIKRAGYCNMRSMRARKSFKRDSYLDWSMYTHLVLRVRGDGRSYMLNLATCGTFDIMWNDMFNYILFTRGGPYWQVAKIPFSKFFLASKGRIQDKQCPVPLNRISNVGISVGDKVNGPFSLEIDYIGVEFDPSHSEEFAYEMYRLPNHVAGT
ncbi:complex I intermediate-associated protein 30, mitochondrial isoform X2 [Bacillus rossius redtenbacheri]|uniref:complex I intermediate-associated protein 30, mitochondrial isoform X2 n=1 Tax=Bacillus rossius redtenbacheri TaxID=93214 RepID=UPI002FDE7CD7